MLIDRCVSEIFSSNMYAVKRKNVRKGILIDPGIANENRLLTYLKRFDFEPEYVILTHEHFDHCAGINILERYYNSFISDEGMCRKG